MFDSLFERLPIELYFSKLRLLIFIVIALINTSEINLMEINFEIMRTGRKKIIIIN